MKNWVIEAHSAKTLAVSNNFTEVKLFVEKIGTNRRLFEKTVSWDWQKSFCFLAETKADERSEEAEQHQNLQNTNWLGRKDSNLRVEASKASALPLGYAPIK